MRLCELGLTITPIDAISVFFGDLTSSQSFPPADPLNNPPTSTVAALYPRNPLRRRRHVSLVRYLSGNATLARDRLSYSTGP